MNLDDALIGSKVSFCEAVVILGFGHDDSVWQVQHFGCLRFFFMASAVLCRLRQKSG